VSFMRGLFPSPRHEGVERVPADRALYTQKERGVAALSRLNHRFNATVLWAAPKVDTTSSSWADLPYTGSLRCFRLSSKR